MDQRGGAGVNPGRSAVARIGATGLTAWAIFTGCLTLFALTVAVALISDGPIVVTALFLAAFQLAPAVGAIVASRQPRNAIGWLLLASGLAIGVLFLADEYMRYLSVSQSELSAGLAALSHLISGTFVGLLFIAGVCVPLLFPDGRLLSSRWRPALYAGAFVPLLTAGLFFRPGEVTVYGLQSPNPFGLDGMAWLPMTMTGTGLVLVVVAAVAAAVSVVLRFRRSHGDERQQLKWFGFAAGLAGFAIALTFFAWGVLGWDSELLDGLSTVFVLIVVPGSIGIAILRHQLYDIDVLINRALVYGSLTVGTLGSYLVLVLGFGWVVRTVIGRGSNELAVAATTLVVAALFQPARSSAQSLVDRRFYRARYDAAVILEKFQFRLRDQTDLESLREELDGVVRATVQPSSVSVWLRDRSAPRS